MNDPILVAGSFEPGATVAGKTVKSWGLCGTVQRYILGECCEAVIVRFTDGTKLYATSVRNIRL